MWAIKTGEKVEDTWDKREPAQLLLGVAAPHLPLAYDTSPDGDQGGKAMPELRGLLAAVRSMAEGEVAELRVAPRWAYGCDGSFSFPHVPGNATLRYEAQLLGSEAAERAAPRGDMLFEARCERASELKAEGNALVGEEKWAAAACKYQMVRRAGGR